jgi:hypothetical protein
VVKAPRFDVGKLLFFLMLGLSLVGSGAARADIDDDLKQNIIGAWATAGQCQNRIQLTTDGRVVDPREKDSGRYVVFSGWVVVVIRGGDPKAHPNAVFFKFEGGSLIGADKDGGALTLVPCPG